MHYNSHVYHQTFIYKLTSCPLCHSAGAKPSP